MSNFMPSTKPTFATCKRTACDRCRGQKLRCPPRANESDPCSRCIRQGAHCSTSYSRSTGQSRARTGTQPTSQPQLMPRPADPAAMSESPPATTVSHEMNLAIGQIDVPLSDDYQLSLSISDMMYLDSMQHQYIGNQHGIAYSDFHSQLSDPTHDNATMSFNDTNRESLKPNTSSSDGQMAPSLIESDHQVCEFNLKLARRLQQCRSFFNKHERNNEEADSDKGDTNSQGSNLFGNTLNDTSEFLAILQAYTAHDRPLESHSTNPRPGMVLILSFMSSYLQLVIIYDELFSYLQRKLTTVYTGAAFGMPIFPHLQLAGFSVQQDNLQVKILIQTTVHQFEMIERTLGIPPLLRVTDKQEIYSGLFEDETAKNIIETIGGVKVYPESSPQSEELRALRSLRENLKRIWSLSEA